jgi:hypothetical protein
MRFDLDNGVALIAELPLGAELVQHALDPIGARFLGARFLK